MATLMKSKYKTTDQFKEDFEKNYTLTDLAELMGWFKREDMKGNMICCPFHKENTPSCQIGDHWFRCYGKCGSRGDIYSFAMKKLNLSYPEVINIIATTLSTSIEDKMRISKKQEMKNKLREQWNQYVENYKKYISTNKALSYQASKLFPIECGYNIKDNRIVVPYTGPNSEIYGFTQRRLNENDQPKWKHSYIESSLTDTCGTLIGVCNLQGSKSAYLVEGPSDMASMLRANYRNTLAIGGTQNYNKNTLNYMLATLGIESLTLFMDGDNAGMEGLLHQSKFTILNYYFLAESSYIMLCDKGSDPGDLNPERIQEIEKNKMPMIDWYLNNISKQQLIQFYHESNGKAVRKNIIEHIMKTYNVKESECLKVLMADKDDYIDSEKKMLQASAGVEKFMKSDTYKKMSPEKAKSILKRKYGIEL